MFFVNLAIGLPALLPARRLLRERGDETATGWPDAVGALLLATGVAALALGIVKGGDWGWASARTVGSLAAAAILPVLFVARSARHPSPVIELAMFRVWSFAVANLGILVFSVGFFALLLCNVLFLTAVWRYSVLGAGLALTPAPIMAALAAPIAGRLADRFGQRTVAIPGSLLFGAWALLLAANTTPPARYWAEFLPAALLAGLRDRPGAARVQQRRRGPAATPPLRHRHRHRLVLPAARRGHRDRRPSGCSMRRALGRSSTCSTPAGDWSAPPEDSPPSPRLRSAGSTPGRSNRPGPPTAGLAGGVATTRPEWP